MTRKYDSAKNIPNMPGMGWLGHIELQMIRLRSMPINPYKKVWAVRLPANRRRMLDAVAAGSKDAPQWVKGFDRTQEERLF